MEKRMEECAREILKDPSIRGVACTDTNGALFCGKGSLDDPHCSAVISQLANLAAALEPNSQLVALTLTSPTYGSPYSTVSSVPPSSLGSQQSAQNNQGGSKVLIKTNGVITVAVHK